MANDTSDRGDIHAEGNSSPSGSHASETFFASAHHDHADEIFTGNPSMDAANQPVQQVPVDQGAHVIRVKVTPGEILELAPPFTPDADLAAKEANGNLAIKVGDVTVILEGFIDANNQAPVVVETSDGKPIDIATLIASTDPTIDIQTAAGPAAGPQGGQGADNTGAILALLQGPNGLGGFNAVGGQDQTELSYRTIDNSIIQDRFLTTPTSTLGTGFVGIAEPFLRDPIHNAATLVDFHDFYGQYQTYVNDNPGSAWADFTGTNASGDDFNSYLSQTSFTSEANASGPGYIKLDRDALDAFINDPSHPLTSDGSKLDITMADGDATAFVYRDSDNALVLVFHAHANGDPDSAFSNDGSFEVDSYLIDRLDHSGQGADVLELDIPYLIQGQGTEQTPETAPVPGVAVVNVLDDIPVVGETTYVSFTHATSFKDAFDCFNAFAHGKLSDILVSHDVGHADEDFIFGNSNPGNRDKDNANGPDSDPVRGDDTGDSFVVGLLNINFGADGASGAIPNGGTPSATNPLFSDADPQALTIKDPVTGNTFPVDSAFPGATSHGHSLIVLEHTTVLGIEVLVVGYHEDAKEAPIGTAFVSGEGGDDGSCDVVVFTLLLQTDPNNPLVPFGGFAFELSGPLDHAPGTTLETNIPLLFPIVATDDDGDHPVDPINIKINVNDDSPYAAITYDNSQSVEVEGKALAGVGGNSNITHDFGHVDEDFLKSDRGTGNYDQDGNGNTNANKDGDDIGATHVGGQITLHYGADGPGSATDLALSYTVDTAFTNADGSSAGTSHGHDLKVLSVDGGTLIVGYAEPSVEGPQTVEVFTLHLDPSGHFDFNLLQPLDHDNKLGEPESNNLLTFDVGSITDYDGDKADAVIQIKVNDDKPEIGVVYYNEIPVDSGGDDGGGTFGLSVIAAVTHSTDFDTGRVDEDWLNGGNHDKDANNVSNANKYGDDIGGLRVEGDITVNYGGDGPAATAAAAGGLGLEHLTTITDVSGNPLSSAGHALQVLVSTAGDLQVGYTVSDNEGPQNVVVFELTLVGNHFVFTQNPDTALDHPNNSPIEDNINLAFNAGSITDFDGDTAHAVIKIQVNDDVPESVVSYTNRDNANNPLTAVSDFGRVDEDFLTTGNHDKDNTAPGTPTDSGRGDELGTTIVTGTISTPTHWGGDGPDVFEGTVLDSPSGAYFLYTYQADSAWRDADGNPLTSHGHDLLVLAAPGEGFSNTADLKVGYHNGDGTDTVVFELSLTDPTTTSNHFQFELKQPLDEARKDGDKAEDGIVLAFGASDQSAPSDRDGDPAARIVIHVNDDAPKAVNDDADHCYAGNVILGAGDPVVGADKVGADGATVTAIKFGKGDSVAVDPNGADTTISGKYGDLTIHDDGTWSYYAAMTPTFTGGTEKFTYTITDFDGDKSSAELKIEVDGPTHIPGGGGSFGTTMSVTDDYDGFSHTESMKITDDSGSHTISGGSGDDYILGKGGNDNLNGNDGNDILDGGAGNDVIHGGHSDGSEAGANSDDTIFGGAGNDTLFGDAGHNAMAGGSGDDLIVANVHDLTGDNLLDGTHTIDGGTGIDTLDLSHVGTFGVLQATYVENVEVLKLDNGGGTTVTLGADSVYGITEVGGLHALTISGDALDHVNLQGAGTWTADGTTKIDGTDYNVFHATASVGGVAVTVNIDTHITDQHTNTP